jgi:hypothetical protein
MVISQRGKFSGEMAHQFGASFAFKNCTLEVFIEAWVQGKLEVLDEVVFCHYFTVVMGVSFSKFGIKNF